MERKRVRHKVTCGVCNRTFDNDYRNSHNKKYHEDMLRNRKHIKYSVVGAPESPFAAMAKRSKIPDVSTENPTTSTTSDVPRPVSATSNAPPQLASTSAHRVEEHLLHSQTHGTVAAEVDLMENDQSNPLGPAPHVFHYHYDADDADADSADDESPLEDIDEQTASASSSDSEPELHDPNSNEQPARGERFPNNPAKFVNIAQNDITPEFQRRMCALGPCQPKASDLVNGYPRKQMNKSLRSFHEDWYMHEMPNGKTISRSWLEYSPDADAMFCFPCRVFNNSKKGKTEMAWMRSGIDNWRKGLEKVTEHETAKTHINADIAWKIFAARDTVLHQVKEEDKRRKEKQIANNRAILKRLLDIVLFLGKQSLPLRGHDESSKSANRGNFLELVDLIAKYDPTLREHLEKAKKNATYLSPQIQNEFIEALASCVQKNIIEKVKEAGCYSLLVDETSDVANVEQVSFILRYVINGDIIESFLQFTDVSKTDTESLYNCLCDTLAHLGLSLNLLRGQGYDGAANMSGQYTGVRARVLQKNPKAPYVHCNCHCLNLVLVDACKTTSEISNFFGTVEKIYTFIEGSPKRHAIFQNFQKESGIATPYTLKRLSDTRWACHCDALRIIKATLPAVADTLDYIGQAPDFDSVVQSTAKGLLQNITKFEFTASLTVLLELLETIRAASDALQSESIALDMVFKLIDTAEKNIAQQRSEENYQKLLTEAKEVAEKAQLDVDFVEKRVRKRKRLPGEAEDEPQSAAKKFKVNVFYSSIDTCLTQLTERFGQNRKLLTSFDILTPSSLVNSEPSEDKLQNLVNIYGTTLGEILPDIDPLRISHEFEDWRDHVIDHFEDIFPNGKPEEATIVDLHKYLYNTQLCLTFPNVDKLYQIFLTIPTTTAANERSFSKLKIIKTYRRSTMSESRLSGLSILSIERELAEKIDFEETIDIFASSGPRRLDLK